MTGVSRIGGDGKEQKTVSRDEAKAILSSKIVAGSLKKSDRERAIAFSVGNVNIGDIQDLLA